MKFCSLYSGSSGNSIFIAGEQGKILIDAGMPGKYIEAGASAANLQQMQMQQQMQAQQTPPFYGNPQMQYQQVPPVYQNQYAGKEKGDEIALGIASMCLGIASLLLFCTCVNVAMAIASVILGILQIVKNKNKVFSIVGFVTSGIAFILTILFVIGLIAFSSEEMNNNSTYYHLYDDIYNEMYDDYDFNSYDDIY